ncbi:MAG: hypothetical protein BroJett041_23710 [Candidatus Jettenia caeni]|nr:MAG: hypothetical protein BroJett041_23710 [Candidatus Jettenia caeni]
MRLHGLFIVLVTLVWSMLSSAQVQKWIERTTEVSTKEQNSNLAKKELIELGTAKISEEVIKEIIGDSKYSRNRNLIENKIIKNAARFIPLSKPGDLQSTQEGFKMTLGLRVNMDDLQAILLENGLFYEQDGTPIVLPFIKLIDKVSGKSYYWWAGQEEGSKSTLVRESRDIEVAYQEAFQKNNFYYLKPQHYKYAELVPSSFRVDTLGMDEYQQLAQAFSAPLVVKGDILFTKGTHGESYQLDIKLSAIQVSNGRSIAEISRTFDVEGSSPEQAMRKKLKEISEPVAHDLSTQILDAWQKGAIGTSLYKITVKGRLNILQQELFKELLKSKVREIKVIKERVIGTDAIVFEADSAIPPKEIQKKASGLDLNGVLLVAEESNDQEIVFEVKKGRD